MHLATGISSEKYMSRGGNWTWSSVFVEKKKLRVVRIELTTLGL